MDDDLLNVKLLLLLLKTSCDEKCGDYSYFFRDRSRRCFLSAFHYPEHPVGGLGAGCLFVNGDLAYLATGRNGSLVTSAWAYYINADRWAQRSPYPRSQRFGSVAFTVSGKSFPGTGNTGNNTTFDDFDQFLPDVAFNVNDY
jgi:hypothetical protein